MLKLSRTTLIIALALASSVARAQEEVTGPTTGGAAAGRSTETPEDQIEDVLDKEDAKIDRAQAQPKKAAGGAAPGAARPETVTDLANLQPFSDIAVIQRRYLPKTKRFELSASGFTNLNNPFYNSLGGSLRAAYYFREQYAAEIIGAVFGTMSRQATDDLQKNRFITTDNVVTSKSFAAVSFKWNPIYGKITWLNRGIVPFDLNFNVGAGLTQTTDGGSNPTAHFGTSQVFALSKWVAFRWDLIWNMYYANVTATNGSQASLGQNDLFLGVGLSLYFPEATYR